MPSEPIVPAHHTKALEELYAKHGVGETVSYKYAFWDQYHSGQWSISHLESKDQAVRVFETTWLTEQFPGDFKYC